MGLNLPLRSSVKLRETILRNRRRINRAEKKNDKKNKEKSDVEAQATKREVFGKEINKFFHSSKVQNDYKIKPTLNRN